MLVLAAGAAASGSLALPQRIPPAERTKLRAVTDAAALSARVEAPAFPARRDIFEYLLDHLEFATHVTRALRVARYRIWHTADGLHLDDGWGAKGRLELVHAGSGIRAMLMRGTFEQRILPDIRGEAVVIIEYTPKDDVRGRPEIATAISAYVKIDNPMFA